jgi:uncharacterized membrane protein YccC
MFLCSGRRLLVTDWYGFYFAIGALTAAQPIAVTKKTLQRSLWRLLGCVLGDPSCLAAEWKSVERANESVLTG